MKGTVTIDVDEFLELVEFKKSMNTGLIRMVRNGFSVMYKESDVLAEVIRINNDLECRLEEALLKIKSLKPNAE